MVGRTAARQRKHVRGIEPRARQHLAAGWRGDMQTLQDEIERVVETARDDVIITSAHVRAASRRKGR